MSSTHKISVASLIFGIHCTVLVILIVLCSREAFRTNWVYLIENWHSPDKRGPLQDIFFGFCSGLLGVSGFETSANFIEEQKPGILICNQTHCLRRFSQDSP